ncbi:MAG: hypothetical protein GXO47_05210 [Chlorobi bacterium]|nr:hypothetical protein [Chlorobiota bacterium]
MRVVTLTFTLLLSVVFVLPVLGQGNGALPDNTAGIRFGGGDGAFTELTYQHMFDEHNRMEVDFGFSGTSYWSSWAATTMYQWVMPVKNDFYWYLGGGPIVGHWNEVYVDYYGNDGGVYFAGALLLGVEYYFPAIPLQIALDIRPEIAIANRWDSVGGGLGFSLRYVF